MSRPKGSKNKKALNNMDLKASEIVDKAKHLYNLYVATYGIKQAEIILRVAHQKTAAKIEKLGVKYGSE